MNNTNRYNRRIMLKCRIEKSELKKNTAKTEVDLGKNKHVELWDKLLSKKERKTHVTSNTRSFTLFTYGFQHILCTMIFLAVVWCERFMKL